MFIDYLTVMLFNAVAGYLLLGCFIFMGMDEPDRRRWATGFGMTGLVALLCGLRLIWTWPLPGSYNIAYGETSVLFGTIMLGLAVSIGMGWNLLPVAIYGIVGALVAFVTGNRMVLLGMTAMPRFTGLAFVLSGLSGIVAISALYLRQNRIIRALAGILLVAAALMWAAIAFRTFGQNLRAFAEYTPPTAMSAPR